MSGWKNVCIALQLMATTSTSLDTALQRLRTLRLAILRLHKAMLDSERVLYEQFHGRIRTNSEFFQLVISDDWFSWLRPISQFVVQIDDVIFSKEPVALDQVNALLDEARVLLQPAENGTTLEKGYFRSIQRDPNIALMHADVAELLGR